MASTRSRAWGPTHPSAAFLIKCAKEREKLRSTLQSQLQEHMLHMLKNKLFADTLIGVDSGKHSVNENKFSTQCLHPNLPQLHHAHKSILKVRTPAFYDHLIEHKETHLGVESYNSFLGESELQQFLGNVYSDDDIRKHECEALRLSKKYIELSCQNKGPVNKHIVDVDEFEKESVNSTCTDTFVTPKTSPVSPENKVDVSDMFRSAQNRSKRSNKVEKATISQNDAYNGSTFTVKSVVKKERQTDNRQLDTSTEEDCNERYDRSIEGYKIAFQGNESLSGYSSRNDGAISDQESEPDNFSNVGSMVRSNTFDLETQGPLEDAIDDTTKWCFRSEAQLNGKSKETSVEKEHDGLSIRKLDSTGFFLHDHTPSPKSSLFKHGFPKEMQYSSGHESDSSSGLHIRRFDGSMTDSGFLSHSTFSVISDTGISNSISSSLILSSEDSPPVTSAHMSELNSSNLEKTKHLSGSMFPFYIDMNSLPPPSPNSRAEKKLSPSHTYMYIDARNPRSNMSVRKKLSYMNTSYDEFLTELEATNNYSSKEPLTKAQSTSHLDAYREEFVVNGKDRHQAKSRPQSCYMYVDLDALKDESHGNQNRSNFEEISKKQEQSAVAMFVNLHEASNQGSDTHDVDSDNTELDLSGEVDSKTVQEIMKITREYQASNQRRKLSDSSLAEIVQERTDPNLKFFALTKNNESRSVSSLDYQSVIGHDEPPQSRTPTFVRKARSAHRYSDGMYYDNLYVKKISPNFCNSVDGKIWNDSKNCQVNDMKILNHTVKLLHNFRNEESSGSCSNLGKIDNDEKLDSFDRLKWKSTGDMGKSKYGSASDEHGLLPMSPILRRKPQSNDVPKSAPPPIIVKASTKPEDIDALKFPKSLIEETSKLTKSPPVEIKPESMPNAKAIEKVDDVKSSSESLKLGSEEPSELSDFKDKKTDSVSRSGSSGMTASGGDSSSDRHIAHDVIKDKMAHSSLSFSVSCDFEDDSETIYSEVSDVSSSLGGIASLERHWRETHKKQGEFTSQNSTINYQLLEACSKLGEDLLRMFLEEIDTDIVVEVDGKEIKAHRCILASRCKYFANLLRRSNPDKNSSTISLEGFSHCAVHFALCHIYSGAMNIPKDCNISELALLADMLNLETLTDVIVFHLKMHFCHFFHRPCLQCVQGVVECLPLAAVCGLNELRDKCIYWLGKYFTRTWPNKSFAALSEELRDLCYNVTTHNLAIDTVIDMTLNCDRLMNTLPQLKWTEPIFGMVTKLLQDCIHFMAKNFNKILNSETFIALGKGQSWNITALEDDIISSVELTTPDVACRSYVTVNNLLLLTESDETTEYGEFTQNFVDLLHKISRHCERYLIQNANKVVHCESWACLSPQVQKRIKDAAVIVFEFEKPTAPPPRLSSLQRKLKKQSEAEDSGCLERSTYPKKGKSMYLKKHPQETTFSPKHSSNTQYASDQKDRLPIRKETENMIKKIVSPIKEEAQNNSIDRSVHDTSYDVLSSALNLHNSPCYLSNKGYIDAHEEDSLRDLQDLPQDQSQSPVPYQIGRDSQLVSGLALCDNEGSRSPAHCSDNPDSLEVNEEISSDSKDEVDGLLSAEDGSNQEKGLNETPEVLEKSFASLERKKLDSVSQEQETNKPAVPVRRIEKMPVLQPLISHSDENNKYNKIQTERSPVKKAHGKSFVPLAKTYGTEVKKSPPSPDTKSKDLVAEIDADSRMVSHCLQEAEMLEQQLSRKLQRQHQVGSSNVAPYSPNKTHAYVDHHKSSKSHSNRLQKASSTSQIKNLAGASVRGKSPGRIVKSNASSPSIGHAPRISKVSDSTKDKASARKSSQSPKSIVTSTQRSFRSMESIASVQKQLSVSVSQVSRRVSSRSSRPKAINVTRTPIAGPKGL
ncbi:uncharacterized protein LOC129216730 [Uloborus diversus]|uniref:uncharacterized protein LOC129216730 n=1 Tax=Uloborus diversus TaxID=327109 RepID=UPI002409DB10|nr:uncharacterized protein LOC129216730 [Uloborus diversus]